MALKKAALLAALDTDPDYDADVVAGASGNILAALHTPDPAITPKRYHAIPIADFQGAVAVEYAGLSAALRGQIDSYLASQAGNVPVHKPGVQAWINANLPASKAAIIALAQQDGRPCDTFFDHEDDTRISKADVIEAMLQISKCQMHPDTQATLQAAKQVKRDAGAARRVTILAQWKTDGRPVREAFANHYPIPKDATGQQITERHIRLEGRELIERFRESLAANPL